MATNTVRLHRVLRSKPERVYRAFLDAGAMAKWLPPNGFTGTVHEMNATVGGTYKMSFTNFSTGTSHSFGGKYLELVPNQRIRYTDKFDNPALPGEMMTTIVIKQVPVGVELSITQEGLPEMIPLEACYLGWQESLTLLAQLVEAETIATKPGVHDARLWPGCCEISVGCYFDPTRLCLRLLRNRHFEHTIAAALRLHIRRIDGIRQRKAAMKAPVRTFDTLT
jgi:uncharacterized protein YndB with AHSA1/START domain